MNSQIQNTGLWKIGIGSKDSDLEIERKKERLRSVLGRFREHASVLTSRISATFPQLTIHDITHLDALWETADLIAGDGYPLNPLEAFVLGGAILLHDAAHCFEAYAGGREAVRNTLEWKDSFAAELAKNPKESRESLEQYCDFTAIRLLHARQAEKLGEYEWRSEASGDSFFLIEDADLRSRYGALIGKIAASHNWSIEDVKTRLRNQVNAPGAWPSEWRVDPIKVACLLRCADAAHFDERRAPDFIFALIRRSGISLDHWKAQNWLARADVDQSDMSKGSLLITSTRAFDPEDAKAWWVAYDAVSLLDGELRSANDLLRSRVQRESSSPAFKIQRVTGANSPIELSKSIETNGWVPTNAKLHVGNVQRLVETLGGRSLYGAVDSFAVVLRELIQNARDAIAARRALDSGFVGKILVKVSSKSASQTSIEIRDDGVGMSERTMTDALLDFGTSFWATDLVRSEFPGLRSSSFRPVGQFGIGFHAVFMIATELFVASRRFDEGLADVTRMHFSDGLTLRPVLAKGADQNYDVMSSTIVRITIDEPFDRVENRLINEGNQQFELRIPFRNYLATIVAGLDVPVVLSVDNKAPVTLHQGIQNLNEPGKIFEWIRDITFIEIPDANKSQITKEYVEKNFTRLRRIEQDGEILGLAALLDMHSQNFQFLTTETIGGLSSVVARGASSYMGYMENSPASAKREVSKKIVSPDVLRDWADGQLAILKSENATREQLYWAASNICNLDLDPIEAIHFPLVLADNRITLLTFEEIFNILQNSSIPCLVSRQFQFAETNLPLTVIDGLPTLRPLSAGSLIRVNLENGKPLFPESLIGCLDRLVSRRGRELEYEIKPLSMQTVLGAMDALFIKLKKP